jgi:Cu(I)/Ag(I) efflux system protein CusF
VIKAIDVADGKVTLAHGVIASPNWPPMTMAFTVKDKLLFDRLVVGSTVHVELVKEGSGFLVTAVK